MQDYLTAPLSSFQGRDGDHLMMANRNCWHRLLISKNKFQQISSISKTQMNQIHLFNHRRASSSNRLLKQILKLIHKFKKRFEKLEIQTTFQEVLTIILRMETQSGANIRLEYYEIPLLK